MPITVERRPDEDLTIFTATGAVGFSEQMEALRAFYGNEPTPYVIWDFRRMEGPRLSTAELRAIIAFTEQHADRRRGGRTALVTANPLDYGLSRMGAAISEASRAPWLTAPFTDMESALDWIRQERTARRP